MSAKIRRRQTEFLYNGGIAEFIKHLNRGKSVLHDTPIYMEGEKPGPSGTVGMEIALQYNDGYARDAFQLRQQHQYGGWRNTPQRFPHRSDAHDQFLRAAGGFVQGRKERT